jgi:hypothetical protein
MGNYWTCSSICNAVKNDEPWFHELLHPDGTAYDVQEVETFRRLTAD